MNFGFLVFFGGGIVIVVVVCLLLFCSCFCFVLVLLCSGITSSSVLLAGLNAGDRTLGGSIQTIFEENLEK